MRCTLTSLFILLIGITAADARRISGRVILAEDNEPAAGATVSIYDSANKLIGGEAANKNGEFNINAPSNAAKVEITYVGQATQTFSISELNNRTITLESNPYTLGEVVVTATRTTGSSSGGDGCDNEANDRITPELALCNVHAYNIGQSTNPSGADKQLMKDVVALKTTVIAQQMNKQYEYMDSMIRRFKTQLEKAVLTTKLQAAGATPTSSDGGASAGGTGYYGSATTTASNTTRGISNAEDCMNSVMSSADAMQCLLRNIAKIQSAVTSGDLGAARQQLSSDRTTLSAFNQITISCDAAQANCTVNVPCENALADGKNCDKAIKNGSNRNELTTCVGQFRACIIANSESIQRSSTQQRK